MSEASMGAKQVGMVGLGVMGQNLALNLADKGFSVAGYDAWPDPVDRFVAAGTGADISGEKELAAFVAALERPRRIILLVKAGEVVDNTLAQLTPLLAAGDMVIDGGNEFFEHTERRAREMADKGFRYFGMGVSGGEEGARHGPSLMPGGDLGGYREMEPMLTKIAAQADGACVTYVGPGGSGHYVKMVHNGIEYGDMQLIAESYDLLKHVAGLSNAELADSFAEWNRGELESYLIEITSHIFRTQDPEGSGELIDMIADAASMKGTGKWAVQQAADIASPVPTMASAVDARVLSSARETRRLAQTLPGPRMPGAPDRQLAQDVRAALYAAKICAYAQGMAMLRAASLARGWNLSLAELARIWTGGCIIRARFLGRIKEAFLRDAALVNLLVDESFQRELAERQDALRRVITSAVAAGIPVPAHASALAYYDTLRRQRLPQNLTQAQRDYFGAHTYERVDRPGTFHTRWTER
jgi:6-phosphogluconate dehydrogenase